MQHWEQPLPRDQEQAPQMPDEQNVLHLQACWSRLKGMIVVVNSLF
jgi:hypothetical protein